MTAGTATAPRSRPWRPRLIGIDIDGTLAWRGVVSGPVRDAVARAVDGGAAVVLCTARTAVDTGPILALLAVPGVRAACSNGAVLLDSLGRVTRQRLFHPAKALGVLRERLPDAEFAVERLGVGEDVTEGLGARPGPAHRRIVTDVSELICEPVPRMVACWPGRQQRELADRMAGVRLPDAEFVLDHEYPSLFVSPAGVNKGAALEELRRDLGVGREETMAVGDGFNDIGMLRWAAHAVAMGQAPESVRRCADEVAATAERDGLAGALDRWFSKQTEWDRG